jgi:uncharacterized protein
MKQKLSVYNLIIAIILILIIIIGSLVIFVNPVKKNMHKPVIIQNDKPNADIKPVFRYDGELRFLNGKTNEIIAKIDIEVADDEAEKAQGLMFRDSMAENQGMLFLMGIEEPQAFWMKNTILSLDILFVGADRRIVSIQKNTKPFSLDQIPSGKPALYVVEVNAGYTEKHSVKVGDMISF